MGSLNPIVLEAGNVHAWAETALADGDAKAALELVLAVVEEGAQGQRQRQGQQLLLQGCPDNPITVHRAW